MSTMVWLPDMLQHMLHLAYVLICMHEKSKSCTVQIEEIKTLNNADSKTLVH